MPFFQRKSPPSALTLSSFLWPFIRTYGWTFLATLLLAIAVMLIETSVWPSLLRKLVDAMVQAQPGSPQTSFMSTLKTGPLYIFMGMAGTWVCMELIYRLYGFSDSWLFPRFEAAIRKAMLRRLMEHSHSFFANHPAGSLANKVNDMSRSPTRIFTMVIGLLIPVLVSIVVISVIFANLHIVFAGIFLGWAIIHIGIGLYFAPRCNARSAAHAASRSALQGRIVDIFSNMVAVRIFARQAFEYKEFLPRQNQEQQQQTQSLFYIEKMKIALGVASMLCIGVGEMGGALYAWSLGIISLGEAVLILNASWGITGMLWILSSQLPELFKEMGVCNQALSLLRITPEIQDIPHAKTLEVTRGEIVFDQVVFDYRHSTQSSIASPISSKTKAEVKAGSPLFYAPIEGTHKKIPPQSVCLKAGEKVGLVGESGGGKTTFVHLILRYYDLQAGRILIDGQDIHQVTQASLRENVSFIPQDPLLFHRSVLENIRYGSPQASDEEVHEAARLARCDGFIKHLSEGYYTQVGERGVKLSGGQRQRIAIARAFLKNAPILILDEATSALDSLTETEIQESLYSLTRQKQHCTTLVIAHRLSTLLDMDRILVFHQGEIVEDGSHEALIAKGGRYAKLWEMQSGS